MGLILHWIGHVEGPPQEAFVDAGVTGDLEVQLTAAALVHVVGSLQHKVQRLAAWKPGRELIDQRGLPVRFRGVRREGDRGGEVFGHEDPLG